MFPTFKEGIEYNAILGENGTKCSRKHQCLPFTVGFKTKSSSD